MKPIERPPDRYTKLDSDHGRLWLDRFYDRIAPFINQNLLPGLTGAGVLQPGATQTFKLPSTFTADAVFKGQFLSPDGVNRTSLFAGSSVTPASTSQEISGLYAQMIVAKGARTTFVPGIVSRTYNYGGAAGTELWGIATESWNLPGIDGILVGGEFAVISQNDNQTQPVIGIDLPFKDRPDGAAAPVNGFGANKYNKNSFAIQISAQGPSGAGENCGWGTGVIYQPHSIMPINPAASGIGHDMRPLAVADCEIFAWVNAGVQFRWEAAGAIRTYWDTGSTSWRIDNAGTLRLVVNTTTGDVTINPTNFLLKSLATLPNGAGAAAGTLTNAPAAGNPTKWIPIDDNGVTRFCPVW